jgi:dGTPase
MTATAAPGDPTADPQARFVAEPVKDPASPGADRARGAFARDRARVLHSAAFRRLAAKTQVHTPDGGADGFLRTRLTHSLEVAQIAREIGQTLGCDPDVVETAGLAHDLGHPPFGHNGEDALHEMALPCGGFEGNAQTLRVLTRLEAKVVGPHGAPAGLNLTRASLDAACKYPWPRQPGQRKFGVYADDAPVFAWLRAGAGPAAPRSEAPATDARRCLEAQVMDWADDVAYSVHDVEDGVITGQIRLGVLVRDGAERTALCQDVAQEYSPESPSELGAVLDDLLSEPVLAEIASYDGGSAGLIALKRAASLLIGRFVSAAIGATRGEYGAGPLRRYDADLVVPRQVQAQCALLKGIALRYVMRHASARSRLARQRDVIRDLVATLTVRAPQALDPVFGPLWRQAADDAARLRVVVDQVASLTDPSAEAWHRRLCA